MIFFQFVMHTHLILIVNALLTHWIAPAYLFYNLLFMVAMLWVVGLKDSIEAAQTVTL